MRINKFSSGVSDLVRNMDGPKFNNVWYLIIPCIIQMEMINCHRIIRKDQVAANGVVHVIDGVLDLALAQNSDIIELAARDGRFGIFAKALENSELGNRIRFSETPCTIFAPTDDAFREIPKGQLNDMLTNQNSLNGTRIILKILSVCHLYNTYFFIALIAHHVVTHPVCVPNIISEYHATTMQQRDLILNCGPHGPIIDHASLKSEMYHGQNGLLYILDHVLLPDQGT